MYTYIYIYILSSFALRDLEGEGPGLGAGRAQDLRAVIIIVIIVMIVIIVIIVIVVIVVIGVSAPAAPKTFERFYGFRRWFFNGFRRGRERFLMVSVVGFLMASGCYRTAAKTSEFLYIAYIDLVYTVKRNRIPSL